MNNITRKNIFCKITCHKIYSFIIFLCFVTSCTNETSTEKINPSLVRVYLNEVLMQQGKSETSFIPLDFKATADNGFVFIGVGGKDVETKTSRNAVLCLMKIDNSGNVLWEKYYDDAALNLGFGFPTNLIPTTVTDEYVLFWNKNVGNSVEYYQIKINIGGTTFPTPEITKLSINTGTNINPSNGTKNGGYIAKAAINLAKNGYVLMNVATNSTRTENNEQHKVLINNVSSANPMANTTLLSESVIKGLRQGIEPLLDYDNHYQIFNANSQYYYNIPDGNDIMALASVGGTQNPIFRDSTSYWVASIYEKQNNISLIINAKNAKDESYYIQTLDLSPNNYDIAKIANLAIKFSPALSSKSPAILTTTKDGIPMICGTHAQSGGIALLFVKNPTNISTYELANTNYTASNIVESQDGNLVAIGGINSVLGQSWKKPFVILIPKKEFFK